MTSRPFLYAEYAADFEDASTREASFAARKLGWRPVPDEQVWLAVGGVWVATKVRGPSDRVEGAFLVDFPAIWEDSGAQTRDVDVDRIRPRLEKST